MQRSVFIERVLRQIYGGQPSDDATITINLVNNWLNDATAVAAKKNYTDSLQLDGVAYMNNSFFTTFKGLTLLQDEDFLWKITLPELPLGIGVNDGVSRVLLKTPFTNEISYTVVLLTENQRSFARGMRTVQNKLLGYQESKYIYIETPFTAVYNYTASVTMVSGGDSTNLDSELNVPADYYPAMVEYLKAQLMFEKSQPVDVQRDGMDAIKTT